MEINNGHHSFHNVSRRHANADADEGYGNVATRVGADFSHTRLAHYRVPFVRPLRQAWLHLDVQGWRRMWRADTYEHWSHRLLQHRLQSAASSRRVRMLRDASARLIAVSEFRYGGRLASELYFDVKFIDRYSRTLFRGQAGGSFERVHKTVIYETSIADLN